MARFIGDYEVISELGVGHFGAVWLAVGETPARGRNPAKRRLVAIKKLRDASDSRSLELLRQEFALLDQVKHRGVVRVFELIDGENAVVMEHIHGLSLREVLEQLQKAREQVFTEAAIEIGCELADALYQAYTTPGDNGEPLRLVHRDLKPANVMLTPQGEVKILDFGLARVDNADFARDDRERIKGTPIYMAPEQARGQEVDHRTDLFALGLILYELLRGVPAYAVPTDAGKGGRDPVAEVFAAIEKGDLSRQCAELEARLPALGPIVTRLLQRRPEDRYQTGHDLLVDLRRQLYRDRGAYLQEFCEFFFSSVRDIGEAPSQDDSKGRANRGRRLSIEERLKQSMARDNKAVVSTPAGAARAPVAQRAPSPPPAPAPSLAPPPPPPASPGASPGADMPSSDSGGGRRPVRPPVGGAASRAEPFAPAGPQGRGPGGKLRSVGQRAPDETGMLEMVPLSSDGDDLVVQGDPSATAFFAIPAPKAERGRAPAGGGMASPPPPVPAYGAAMASPPPGPPPSPSAMGGYGAPPPPPSMGYAPPPPPPMGYAAPPPPPGPVGVMPPPMMAPSPMQAAPMIQGPVAGTGYGQAQMGASPFQVSGPTPMGAPGAEADQRVQSTRLYAILFALFVLVGVTVVVAFWLRPGGDPEDPVPTAASTPAVVETVAKKEKAEDTGAAAPPPPPPKAQSTRKSSGTTTTSTASTPKPPSGNPGAISVRLSDPAAFTSVLVLCPSGYRQKGTFAGGAATISGVPAGESCTLSFQGGLQPGRFNGAKAGQSLSCSMVGTGMVCK